VAERKGVSRLVTQAPSTRKRVPLPFHRRGGYERTHKKNGIKAPLCAECLGLLKPTDHEGQQGKDNRAIGVSQLLSKMFGSYKS